ncbi:hypothetical protein C0993_002313 [Termitomyces sp. T159_Od127]|nr:hypothetical protein C0993_002313 [Termitomyces sp. T159_Od127]
MNQLTNVLGKILLEPYAYILSMKGKEIRSKLIEVFNFWLDVPAPKLAIINRLVNMLHNASLLQVPLSHHL